MANSAQRRKHKRKLEPSTRDASPDQIDHMPRAGPKEPKPPQRKDVEQSSQRPKLLLKILRWAAELIVWAAALLGVVTGYLALVPRVSVSPAEPLNPSNPLATPFITSNEGPLGMNAVSFSCVLTHIKISAPQNSSIDNIPTSWSDATPAMAPGERSSDQCFYPFAFGSPMESGDIKVVISFRPNYWPFRMTREFRFVTFTTNEGRLIWMPKPVSQMSFAQQH
jgi:hypothetical protein